MHTEIGYVEAIFRYPVKSMAGQALESADLGWHGLQGDRRMALRRVNDHGEFPFLTASKLSDLVRFAPIHKGVSQGDLPTHVRTPEGNEMAVFGAELAKDIERRYGAPVEMMQFKNGIFDDACISVIASDTVREVAKLSGCDLDVRRFRPNIVIRLLRPVPFEEDQWLGSMLAFGDEDDAPSITVTMRDLRCGMVNIDPDSGHLAPEVMKAIVRANENYAGVYGAVTSVGGLKVGQTIRLRHGVISNTTP